MFEEEEKINIGNQHLCRKFNFVSANFSLVCEIFLFLAIVFKSLYHVGTSFSFLFVVIDKINCRHQNKTVDVDKKN